MIGELNKLEKHSGETILIGEEHSASKEDEELLWLVLEASEEEKDLMLPVGEFISVRVCVLLLAVDCVYGREAFECCRNCLDKCEN